jgi:hypothetical protein
MDGDGVMAFLNREVVFSKSGSSGVGYSILENSTVGDASHQELGPAALDHDEILAAYLSREPLIAPMMQVLLEMSEEQRRLALSILQCISLGSYPPGKGSL